MPEPSGRLATCVGGHCDGVIAQDHAVLSGDIGDGVPRPLVLPREAGEPVIQVIGTAAVYLADEKIREIDLTAAAEVKEGWFLSRFGITNLQTVILFFVLALILAFIILIAVLRTINKRKRRAARQRRLMEAARRQMERERDLKQRNWPY